MNFNELVAEVLILVKRPDKQAECEAAVRAATIKAHNSDFFYRDLIEQSILFTYPAHLQGFKPADNFPRYRKVKYVRLFNEMTYGAGDTSYMFSPINDANNDVEAILGCTGPFLKAIDVENSIDGYGYNKENVFYMAGDILQMRANRPIDKVLVGVYVNPDITPTAFNSWIAVEAPYAIIYEASRRILMGIGKNQDAQNMQTLLAEEYARLTLNSVNKPGE